MMSALGVNHIKIMMIMRPATAHSGSLLAKKNKMLKATSILQLS